ncbi:hypothetical protein EN962_13990 [Mesorhizobium sp. M7A.F.Ca.CA.001.09.2.1]|uniref:Ribbon-helix-helix protein CopG domain-containing protein n=3 Tax=Mesorhizobium TaxID=68287 RepID=A0AB38T5C5_9HYPH|nr:MULTISPECIES: hypothetical protein [Mesorhizobium]RUY55473.1 hypothetical protein EN981_06695 [Mesorhizobium sp. M7A.F.Ca.CA.001.13.2.1]RVB52881.1 hypothetical protein EN898_22660 [Mesorhizobium sp. M7A.F.Ca.CA.001.06.1.1]MDF3216271.1 hypothetical protein [Mesorhizobium ciceri]RUY63000.1 hypothetical protein EN965_24000 [Mesorhizobium sp. M7A.F.Ca.CA.001.05.1.1]RUY65221.1 hypothetical protein EN980_23275 [Mesorhizobium sp. M7A.F.Ca.CA.001.13.1.1]
MAKAPRENRIPIMMSDDELKSIDDWRYQNRIATRSDAVRRLAQNALRIDDEIDQIYKQTRSLHETILTRTEVITDTLNPSGETDWQRLGKMALAFNSSLIQDIAKLTLAVNSITEQVHRLRSDGEFIDLSKAADEIKAKAKDRAKMLKMMFKAIDEGGHIDEEDDE